MIKLNTQQLTHKFAYNCMEWLSVDKRFEVMQPEKGYRRHPLKMSLRNFREYLHTTLEYLVGCRVGTDSEMDLGHYHLSSSADKEYVVIKRSKRRLPINVGSYLGWTDWDIKEVPDSTHLEDRCVTAIYPGVLRTNYQDGNTLETRLGRIHAYVLSQVLLQGLVGFDREIDLSKKPLPTQEVQARFGNYIMLYDTQMEEWRIWLKN